MAAAVALAIAFGLLAGCAIPCGPTTYRLSGVAASAEFPEETWDQARAEAGLREAGFGPGGSSASGVEGERGNATLRAEPGGGGPIRVVYAVAVAEVEGDRAAVESAGDAIIAELDGDARAAIASFASGAAWSGAGPVLWDKALLHGDC